MEGDSMKGDSLGNSADVSVAGKARTGGMIGRFPLMRHLAICGLSKGNSLHLLNLSLRSGG